MGVDHVSLPLGKLSDLPPVDVMDLDMNMKSLTLAYQTTTLPRLGKDGHGQL